MGAKKIGFDGWVLDPDSGDLERAGTRIRLQEQPLQVLMQLIDSRGGVVTREQLISKLWPKGIVDFDTGVNTAIRKLRVALGDTADTPRYIETLPRRGYRFIAALEPDPAREPEPEAQPQPESAAGVPTSDVPPVRTMDSPPQTAVPPRTGYRRYIALLTALTLALVGVAVVRVWISREPARESAVTVTPSFSPPPHSVAVLPFVNVSGDKDQEYFSDGLSDELIDMLTKVPELRVPARTSSFYFKGKQAAIADIAKALGVAHVLEGSVRKSGNTLRITAQLVRVDNGYHLWSETYDRELDDIFKVQDDIAGAVVKALKLSLLEGQSPRATPVTDSDAYTLFLQARSIWSHSQQPADDQRAIDFLERALKKEPGFARAWAMLANYRVTSFYYYLVGSFQQILARAHFEAQRAIELDPNLSDGHLALGTILFYLDRDWTAAELEYKRAIELDPGNVEAFRLLTDVALNQGRFDEAVRHARMAIQRDPLYVFNYVTLGNAFLLGGRPGEAEAAYRQAVELNPAAAGLHLVLGWALLARGQPTVALTEMERETDAGWREAGSALALDALGRRSESDRALKAALVQNPERSEYEIAQVYANRSDLDNAILWLDRAYARRSGDLTLYVRSDPMLKNLRNDPRYKALLHKMKLLE